jgi:lipoprotein-anchoring transpeptidase ErfK/SrfK
MNNCIFRNAGLVILLIIGPIASSFASERINANTIENAQFTKKLAPTDTVDPIAVKVQVFLDRAKFSPGEIDGKLGENLEKALTAYSASRNLPVGKELTADLWAKLVSDAEPVLTEYVLTDKDVQGPFLEKIPAKLDNMKGLKALSYRNVREEIAERFHMSEGLLVVLNPGTKFDVSGQKIAVANVLRAAEEVKKERISRIEVDKDAQTVKAFDKAGVVVAFYPATVGSDEKPTPSGTLKVVSIDRNPTYRYNPDYKFKGVKSKKPFVIGPGPNNPVGIEWIGLNAEGYGIHGTPEPSKVSKTESHGCVRLTNWDVERLAAMTSKGTPVVFLQSADKTKN